MTKKKLIISLCAFVLVAALGVVGVLAATQATATISTSVQFTATDVVVSYAIKAEKEKYADTTLETVAGSTSTGTIGHNDAINSATKTIAEAINFAEKNNKTIVYTITMINKGSNPFKVTTGTLPTNLGTNVHVAAAIQTSTNGTTWAAGTVDSVIAGATRAANGDITDGGQVRIVYTLTLLDATKDVPQATITFKPTMTGTRV